MKTITSKKLEMRGVLLVGLLSLPTSAFSSVIKEEFTPGVGREAVAIVSKAARAQGVLVREYKQLPRIGDVAVSNQSVLIEYFSRGASDRRILNLMQGESIERLAKSSEESDLVLNVDVGGIPKGLMNMNEAGQWVDNAELNKALRMLQSGSSIRKLYGLKSGLLSVVERNGAVYANLAKPGKGIISLQMDVDGVVDRFSSIEDVVEHSGGVYVLANFSKSPQASGNETWLFKHAPDTGVVLKSQRVSGMGLTIAKAKFGDPVNGALFFTIFSLQSLRDQPTYSLLSIDGEAASIWSTTIGREEQKAIDVIPLCGDRYLVARRDSGGGKVLGYVEYQLVNARTSMSLGKRRMVEAGSIKNIVLSRVGEYLYVLVNFVKTENVRRADGWYFWDGYRVDEYKVSDVCKGRL